MSRRVGTGRIDIRLKSQSAKVQITNRKTSTRVSLLHWPTLFSNLEVAHVKKSKLCNCKPELTIYFKGNALTECDWTFFSSRRNRTRSNLVLHFVFSLQGLPIKFYEEIIDQEIIQAIATKIKGNVSINDWWTKVWKLNIPAVSFQETLAFVPVPFHFLSKTSWTGVCSMMSNINISTDLGAATSATTFLTNWPNRNSIPSHRQMAITAWQQIKPYLATASSKRLGTFAIRASSISDVAVLIIVTMAMMFAVLSPFKVATSCTRCTKSLKCKKTLWKETVELYLQSEVHAKRNHIQHIWSMHSTSIKKWFNF